MKRLLAGAAVALSTLAAPAFAWEGQVVACYDKIWVPPTYKYSKKLIMEGHKEWEWKGHQMIKVWYPPVYKEIKHLDKPGHYIARKAPCKH